MWCARHHLARIEPPRETIAGHPVRRQRHVAQQNAGVDREVVDALLGLLDQRVAENFPGQFLGLAMHFLERLVDRHRADRHRAVPDDPLARLVDVLAGRQVHHRIAAPADRPGHFPRLRPGCSTQGRVADVGVDLGQEVAADDHRLGFRVVDVRRDDRAAARDFASDELGRDFFRQCGAEALPRMLAAEQVGELVALRPRGAQAGDVGRRGCCFRGSRCIPFPA